MNAYEPHEDDGSGLQRALPWLVTATVSVIAIIAAIVFVALANNASARERADAEPTPITTPSAKPVPTTTPVPTPEPSTPPKSDEAPKVDVGNTSSMAIGPWNVKAEVSGKLGKTDFSIEGDTMRLSTQLYSEFPASCAAAKDGWGVKRTEGGRDGNVVGGNAYTVVKPAGGCAADQNRFDEAWGLTQAIADSIKAG